MAYCRWSECDVYVYLGEWGYVTHVAGRRRAAGKCPIEFDFEAGVEAALDTLHRRAKWYDKHDEWADIDHPHAGESFTHETPRECAEFLIELKESGLDVPQHAIDDLLEEAAEEDAKEEE
jgi:hypothetical protein